MYAVIPVPVRASRDHHACSEYGGLHHCATRIAWLMNASESCALRASERKVSEAWSWRKASFAMIWRKASWP